MFEFESYHVRKLVKVREVAKMFNVHPDTIRRWEKKGLITSIRHPMNGYRVFYLENIRRILDSIK